MRFLQYFPKSKEVQIYFSFFHRTQLIKLLTVLQGQLFEALFQLSAHFISGILENKYVLTLLELVDILYSMQNQHFQN